MCLCTLPQTPMDLGTVLAKLNRNAYADTGAALEDIRLVWRNCRTFNEPGSDVSSYVQASQRHAHTQVWSLK